MSKKENIKSGFSPMHLLLSIYILVFLAIIIPFHHHSECSDHRDNCIICSISHQPALAQGSLLLAILLFVLLISVIKEISSKTYSYGYPHLRSPPQF